MIKSVEVTRRGAALRLELDDGSVVVRRHKDLVGLLPETAAERFASAALADHGVDVVCIDGTSERLALDQLLGAYSPKQVDLVIEGAGLVATCDGDGDDRLGLIRDGTLCIGGGRVRWVGPADELPENELELAGALHIDVEGRMVTPGLVDPHTHPVFAGDRADEFARRAAGADYQEIAAAGGGIAATLTPTRAANVEEHVELTLERLARAHDHGTTTCEAKSGYALTIEGELRLLEAIQVADALQPVDLIPTLLGAHVLPPDRAGDRAGYVGDVAWRMVPQAAARGLAASVDVYCDDGAFNLDETRTILEAATNAGLAVRAHVGQFADLGGAELLAELGALSADHVENISDAGIAALADAGVVAVMLPGACVQLKMAPPPVARLRAAGVALAIGTDLNPGSSHSESLPLQMWLATTHYGMTVEEAWLGVTRNAARAVGRHDVGVLTPGVRGDAVIWDAEQPAEIPYHYGVNLVQAVVKAGQLTRVG